MSEPKKIDRRVRRTRALLSQALHQLIIEKPYDSITIQEITDTADLNRATFYLHYGSKEELLMDSLEAQFDALVAELETAADGELLWDNPDGLRRIFEFVQANASLYKVLLGPGGQGYITYRVLAYISRYEESKLRATFAEDALPVPYTFLSRHFAGSLFSLIVWWLEEDMPYSPDYMAEMMYTLCIGGTLPAMLVEGGRAYEPVVP